MEVYPGKQGVKSPKEDQKKAFVWPDGLPKAWQHLKTDEERDAYREASRQRAMAQSGKEYESKKQKRKLTPPEHITGERLYQQLHRQDEECFYSGDSLTFKNVSLEHRVPLCRKGGHVMSNVVLSTKRINRMKGTMTDEEFISVCHKVATKHPKVVSV